MINVSYYSVSAPSGEIRYSSEGEGLCLVSGVEARSFLDILELKGSLEYAGSFRIFDSDLLDINNANRDRYPVSVIRSGDQSFLVQRSQVPLGGTLETTKVDKLVEQYLGEHDLKANQTPNFRHLFQSIYCELCAETKYIVLELIGEDKDFSFAVLDLAAKIFKEKAVFLYAPLLTPNESRTLVLTYDFKSILNPVEDETYLERQKERTAIQMTFISDLRGKENEFATSKKRRTLGFKDFEIDSSSADADAPRGLFSFGKSTDLVNVILAGAFLLVGGIISIISLLSQESGLFIVLFLLSAAALGMSFLPFSILNWHRGKRRLIAFKEQIWAITFCCGLSLLWAILTLTIGFLKEFEPWYVFLLFELLFVLYPGLLALSMFIWHKRS